MISSCWNRISWQTVSNVVQRTFVRSFRWPLKNQIALNQTRFSTTVGHVSAIAAGGPNPLSPSTQRLVGRWLLTCCGMTFGAVALGGLTRLTESGLSMTNWHFWKEFPPLSQKKWEEEFAEYQKSPEFKMKNQNITLEEFKYIWWMEYSHRMWGRAIGIIFFLPAAYFWSRGYLNKGLKVRVVGFGGLIIAQGLLGWYMVKSGLEEERFQDAKDVPRVSHYRLASHLGLAFVLYSLLLWSSLDLLKPALRDGLKQSVATTLKKFRMSAHGTKALIFITAMSGALVAGLDAGLIYDSFPKMADRWIPSDMMALTPALSNFTRNPTTVQFDHRWLGTATLAAITGLWLASRGKPLPPKARMAINALLAMGWMQVLLGIGTLLHGVPVWMASMHQCGSLLTLSSAIWLTHEMKWVSRMVPK